MRVFSHEQPLIAGVVKGITQVLDGLPRASEVRFTVDSSQDGKRFAASITYNFRGPQKLADRTQRSVIKSQSSHLPAGYSITPRGR